MGSSGTGRFSDYTGSRGNKLGSSSSGGRSGKPDRCSLAFTCELEEVERCNFFKNNHSVPDVGTEIIVNYNKRVSVESNGVLIGYLPTQYNYLVACINNGYTYTGFVSASMEKPIASVTVDIAPSK